MSPPHLSHPGLSVAAARLSQPRGRTQGGTWNGMEGHPGCRWTHTLPGLDGVEETVHTGVGVGAHQAPFKSGPPRRRPDSAQAQGPPALLRGGRPTGLHPMFPSACPGVCKASVSGQPGDAASSPLSLLPAPPPPGLAEGRLSHLEAIAQHCLAGWRPRASSGDQHFPGTGSFLRKASITPCPPAASPPAWRVLGGDGPAGPPRPSAGLRRWCGRAQAPPVPFSLF